MILSHDEVIQGLSEIDDLISHLKGWPTFTAKIITGHLHEYKFNLVHHLAGPSCPACDLDFLEVRGDRLAGILEVKKWGRSLSDIQKDWYPRISAGLTKGLEYAIPIIKLEFDHRAPLSRFRVDGGRTLDLDEWREFMQRFEVPAQSLEMMY